MMLARLDRSVVCRLIGFKPEYKITTQNTACLVWELSAQRVQFPPKCTEPPL